MNMKFLAVVTPPPDIYQIVLPVIYTITLKNLMCKFGYFIYCPNTLNIACNFFSYSAKENYDKKNH